MTAECRCDGYCRHDGCRHAYCDYGTTVPTVPTVANASASLRTPQVELGGLLGWLVRQCRRLREEPANSNEQLPPVDNKIVADFLIESSEMKGGLPTDKVH